MLGAFSKRAGAGKDMSPSRLKVAAIVVEKGLTKSGRNRSSFRAEGCNGGGC